MIMRKLMVNIVLLLFIVLLSNDMIAQSRNNMTFNVGYVNKTNSSKWASKVLNLQLSASDTISIHGITAGFEYFLLAGDIIGFDLGLNYTYMFRDQVLISGSTFTGNKYTYHSLDAPIRFMLSIPIGEDFSILLFAGPKLTFDIAGSQRTYINGSQIGGSKDIYGGSSYRSRFDVLLGPGAGLRYKNLIFRGGYDLGLLNLNLNNNPDDLLSNKKLQIKQEHIYFKLGIAF